MEGRSQNLQNKRVFGKDITNIDRRNRNKSFYEKIGVEQKAVVIQKMPLLEKLWDNRIKSKSFDKKYMVEKKDPIFQYQQPILSFMMQIQKKQQKEILSNLNEDMRLILIDWLVDVHISFELKEQTLYLALSYLNAYCSRQEVSKSDYQLVGITCLWIASKYQQIYPLKMQNYVQVTDSSYTKTEMKMMEGKILLTLDFNLNHITPLQILDLVSDKWAKQDNKLTKQSLKIVNMCKYLLQLSLFQGLGRQYCKRTLVIVAKMLADSIFKIKTDIKILENEKLDKEMQMRCFKEMCVLIQNQSKPTNKLKAIKKKYSDEKYMGVAKYKIQYK